MKKYIKSEHYAPLSYSGFGSKPSYVVYYGKINTNTGELDNPQPVAEFYKYNDAQEYALMRNEHDAANGWFFELKPKRGWSEL